ncbi:MAG: ABC transporter ATP-binding protein [Alphaproteobacteria bacterium 40-19]|nr:MAG: ABC transporter ATP-binding protein [Alphaproteobacteria bacterium 40-19]
MKNSLPKKLFPFLWHFLREYKAIVVVYGILAVAAGFWAPFNSVLIKMLINLLPQAAGKDITVLIFPAVLIVVNCILFDNFTWQGIMYIKYRFIPLVLSKVDRTLLDHTLSHSHQFFQERMAGALSKQIFNLIDAVEKIISFIASQLLRGVSVLLMSFVFAYQVNPIFLGILVIWSLVFFTVSLNMSKKLAILSAHKAEKEAVLGGQIIDSLSNVFSIYLFARRKHETTRRNIPLGDWKKAYQNNEMYVLILHAVQGGLIAIMMAFAIFFLVYLYGKSLITAGDFALILGLSMETGHLMWVTMYSVNELNQVLGRCKQSLDYLIVPTDIQDKSNATILKCHSGQVAFHNVTFGYKGAEPIFQNKSITIKSGQKVGLVGYSGGGKSTFVNLILRLYDVTKGAITIDGQDIRDVTQDSLHENIAMIPQDPSLFHRSLMENIRYGRLDATDAEVVEAAEKSHAHEFILQLAQGYQTSAGERGVQLSGGQRQRIAIARAILKNAPILILDEATSQLDSLTEHLIQESLWQLMQNKTTIVIAHRLSTLLHMDRILVFNKGQIVQDGPHQQLLEDGGLYKNLWDTQVGGFLSDKI